MKPIIIAVAITGSVPRKKDNPAVPVTPAEQIESTHQAFEAGASLVHIHVRNPDESSSSDPALFAAVQAGVRKHCPGMIVQFSTGGRGRDPSARGSSLHLKPDMASLATGSVNFPSIVYENSASFVESLAGQMKEHGVLPEIEVFDLSHIYGARRLVDLGLINDRPHVQFVMGIKNALPGRGTHPRSPAQRVSARSPECYLDSRWHRTKSSGSDGLGPSKRRYCSANRPGRQHPCHKRSACSKQCGARADSG
jgi:3-keto-5-aminohexanoate cleavage enzyme